MQFTSFYFMLFFVAALLVYYLVPVRIRWVMLLALSVVYYLLSGNGVLILYPFAVCTAAWIGIRIMGKTKEPRKRRAALAGVVLLLLGILFILKYINFGINTINGIALLLGAEGQLVSGLDWLVPLGISFYTFTVLGYVIDVYNDIAAPQPNLLKLCLYGMYFPAVLSGPILRYREDGQQFFEPHRLDYRQLTFGLQRMLWGFFKTLVISERMRVAVNTVYDSYTEYGGAAIWTATACYAFQLYTNFSGCMDIALGMSECFGIKLPENFNTPFFSKSISEYWRRWHITLGVWMKEYLFYPLLRTEAFTKLGKKMREKAGKKRGKQLTTFLAMLILWFSVGIWHGGEWKYVIGSGLLHWFYIVTGELLQPVFKKGMEKCGLNPENRFLDVLRILRTFFLVNIGFVFFRALSVHDAVGMLGRALRAGGSTMFSEGAFLGMSTVEWVVAIIGLLVLFCVSLLQQKGSVREWIAKKKLPLRWMIWYGLLFATILWGYYGPGYSASEFIYQGF